MDGKKCCYGLAMFLVFSVFVGSLEATICPFKIFTNNGGYSSSPNIILYVDVTNGSTGMVDFTFHNDSLVSSSIAAIYFDGGPITGISSITNGSGTLFSGSATPGNLPAGNMLFPSFTTDFAVGADSPPPTNGINPGEWLRVTFNLADSATSQTAYDQLIAGVFRIGMHVISLPDGLSEAAVNVPEPTTIMLLGGLSALSLVGRRKKLEVHV